MASIDPPDLETRMIITRAKAAQLGLLLDDDAVTFIANTITSNVRQIEGVIKRLTAYKEILDTTIGTEDVKRAIKDVVRIGTFIPSPQLIIRESARYFADGSRPQRSEPFQEHRNRPSDFHVSYPHPLESLAEGYRR